jgi:peptidoglycan/xylan/chitin deacetylase (PgdA/CDA1 family)
MKHDTGNVSADSPGSSANAGHDKRGEDNKLDVRLATMLERAGVAGTFYIAPRSCETPADARLTPNEIRSLTSGFEIGGHTLTHARLPRLDTREAAEEIPR